jgi:hypothetical protein
MLPPEHFRTLVTARFGANTRVTRLLWAGLKATTRKSYKPAVNSYTTWCHANNTSPWPAALATLVHWATGRLYGDPLIPQQAQIAGSTLNTYLAALRSVHVDLAYDDSVFDSPHIRRLVQGGINLFPPQPRPERTPISRALLLRLVSPEASQGEKHTDALAINAAFTLAFAAFLRMGELTYPSSALSDRQRLKAEFLTVPRVSIAPDHLVVVLPRSKTDRENRGVTIRIARVRDGACAATHMERWLKSHTASEWPPLLTPLFTFDGGLPFSREGVLAVLRRRLINIGEPPSSYAGHSFRRGAAQHALESGLSEDEIQELGRWKSDAVKRYYKRSPQAVFDLNHRFQIGRAPPAALGSVA